MNGWHPIETAPTDGRVIRVLNDEGEEDRAWWVKHNLDFLVPLRGSHNNEGEWSAEKGLGPFTHWKPEDEAA